MAELNVTFPLVMVTLAGRCMAAGWAAPPPLHELMSSRLATPAPAAMHCFEPAMCHACGRYAKCPPTLSYPHKPDVTLANSP